MDDSLPLSPSAVRLMVWQVIGSASDTRVTAGAIATEVGLAPRKISVLQFLGNGLSNREIAKRMYISERSVKAYLANACTKLGVRDRLQAVIRGFELSIVNPRLSAGEQPTTTQDPQYPSHQSALSLQVLDLVLPLGLTWFGDGDDAVATPEKEPEVHD